MKDDFFDINKFKEELYSAITQQAILGQNDLVSITGVPNVQLNKKLIRVSSEMAFDQIKGVTKELSKRIRFEIRQSILQGESDQDLARRLDGLFKGDNPTSFNYQDRLRTIARTESTRIFEASKLDTAKKVGAKRKYIDAIHDMKESQICRALEQKYGTEQQAIPLDEEFEVSVGGKTYSGLYPPFHPNCRTKVKYSFDNNDL